MFHLYYKNYLLNTLNSVSLLVDTTVGTTETSGSKYSTASGVKLLPSSLIHSVGKYLTLLAILLASTKKMMKYKGYYSLSLYQSCSHIFLS